MLLNGDFFLYEYTHSFMSKYQKPSTIVKMLQASKEVDYTDTCLTRQTKQKCILEERFFFNCFSIKWQG